MPRLGKNSKKRRSKLKKITKSSVARIAKNVMMKATETKSAMNSFSGTLRHEFTFAKNLLYFMNQGTNATSVVGEQIFLKTINIKGYFVTAPSYKSFPVFVRVVIIKTKKALVTSGLTSITSSDVFRSETGTDVALRSHVDLHKVDLMYDRTFKLPNEGLDTGATIFNTKRFNKTLKINKKITWDAEGVSGLSGFLKDKNIYMVFQAFIPGATIGDNLCDANMTYSVNYKDN